MRISPEEHTSRPWRIHEIAPDFEVEDVWALPTPGGPDDFPLLVSQVGAGDPASAGPPLVRLVWAVRWKLGEWFGWDREEAGVGGRVPSLRDRLPAELRDRPAGPRFDNLPFTPVYQLDDEFAAELANRTVHGVVHLGWVEDGSGGYRGQMAVLVKPNGRLGRLYLALIKPFRYLLVYPALMRRIGSNWQDLTDPGERRFTK